MSVGSFGVRTWAVVFLAAGAGCSQQPAAKVPCPVRNKEHVVLLRAEKQASERYKAIAHPDHLTILGYNPENPDVTVIWSFRHLASHIEFDKSTGIENPDCTTTPGECRLRLPKSLPLRTPFKYTITGKYDDKNDLEKNDPDIEVDR